MSLQKISLRLILVLIVVFNALRFWKLDSIPYGYHINELASAVTVQCMAERGCDAELKPWPVFGLISYGENKPPAYIYPAMVWAKIFGSTAESLRALSVFVLCLGILGLFLLGKQAGGGALGLVVVLTATCSPWAWVITRLAIESFFASVYTIWGLYFFLRSSSRGHWALAAFLFACAMYAYPPARLQVPLMLMTIFAFKRRAIQKPAVFSFAVVFMLSLLPMAVMYMQGLLSRRFDQVGILNRDFLLVTGKSDTPVDLIKIFFNNYFLHFNPDFLFLTGDHSYIYSTRHLGLWGWFDIGALGIMAVFLVLGAAGWRQKNPVLQHGRWVLFLAANYLIGIIPSALTNQDVPHALRMCGSWSFLMLLTGFMWWAAAEVLSGWWPAIALAGAACGWVLVYQYFFLYPGESKGSFGFWAKEVAEEITTPEDWKNFVQTFRPQQYHCRYFTAHRLGLSCQQAKDMCQ